MAQFMPPLLLGEMKEGGKEKGIEASRLKSLVWIFKRAKSANFIASLALFFLAFLFFADLFTDRFILTERDLAPYFIPPRFFWVESIKNGDFPLWNPYQFTGHPFFANPQHAILYPLNVLFFLLPFDLAFNSIIIMHFFLGGFFTYLLLRELGAGASSALLSGIIFMLNGYLLSLHSLLNSLLSVIWTPLIIIFFRRALFMPGLHNVILTALFMTISFWGGGVEIIYGNFLILLLMLICPPSLKSPFQRLREKIWVRSKVFILTSLIFFFLSAIQLFPFLELYAHSIRGQGISFSEATIWSFAPRDLLLFFLPDAYGYFLDPQKYWTSQCWLKTLYTGGLPFLLTLSFFLLARERQFYLMLIFLSFFLALGHYNPLYSWVFKYFPFFSGIRYPVKFLYIFILVLTITAGLGFEKWRNYSRTSQHKKIKYMLISSALLCGVILLFMVWREGQIALYLKERGFAYPHFDHLLVNIKNAQRFFFYLIIFFLILRVGEEWCWPRWVSGLLAILLAADLFGNMGFYGKEKTKDFFQKTRIIEIISADKGFNRTFTTARTSSLDSPLLIPNPNPLNFLKEKHLPSLFLIYQIPHIWGIDVLSLKRTDELYKALINSPSLSATNLIYLYSVKYVISTLPIMDENFELLYVHLDGLPGVDEELIENNTLKLYRLRNFFPRAWLVPNYKILPAGAILSALRKKDFHPAQVVFLEEEPEWARSWEGLKLPAASFNKVELIEEKNNKLILRVSCAQDSLLVLSDTYFPGWKALIRPLVGVGVLKGEREFAAKILCANYNFRALALQAGNYEVIFSYEPFSFKIGLLITFLSGAAILIYYLLKFLKFQTGSGQQRG